MPRARPYAIVPLLLLGVLVAACDPGAAPATTTAPPAAATPTPAPASASASASAGPTAASPTLPPSPSLTAGTPTLDVLLVAGPVCPVVRNPPDPACDPRPVAGAIVVVRDDTGAEVGRLTSDVTGHARGDVSPGSYELEALPSPAAMSVPARVHVRVSGTIVTSLTMEYDTGIR